jgi:dipeptidyl aminopeptidase/acylaminoacyl peptidase
MKKIPFVSFSAFASSVFITLIVFVAVTSTHAAKAASQSTTVLPDVQYSTVLDYSSTNALIETSSFAASSTYNCSLATLGCTGVSASTQNLTPSSLSTGALAGTSSFESPDYTMALVAFTNNQVPAEKLYSILTNVPTLVATLPALQSAVSNVYWSGNNSVLLIKESGGVLQKYDSATKTVTTLSSTIPSGAAWITVSPNGRYLAYYVSAVVSTGQRTFGVIDTTADKTYTLNEHIGYWDLLSEGVRIFAFSPDSTKLLYLDDRSGYQTLYDVDLTKLATVTGPVTDTIDTPAVGGAVASPTAQTDTMSALAGTQVTAKPYAIEDMQWENNSTIVFTANRTNALQWSLFELNLNTYALTKITDFVAAYDQPMQTIGSKILFETADANGRLVKVFNTATKAISGFQLPGVNQSIIGSANTVVKTDGISSVYMPAATATSTLLVWLHGGPDRQSAIEYNSYMSYGGYDWVLDQVRAAGVPVLKVDYPGSVGESNAFAATVKGGVGTADVTATMKSVADFATAHGYKNIYIMGNSYGGYLGLKMLVTYPSQIKGMLSLSSVTDWQTLLTNIPSSIFSLDFGGSPNPMNQSLYDAASIINNLSNLGNQKVIVVQGNVDDEVPYQQSVLLNKALVAAGKNVEYYTLNNESHIYELPASYTLVCNKAFELVGLPQSSACVMQ